MRLQFAFFNQIKPVSVSVTVPLLQSTKRLAPSKQGPSGPRLPIVNADERTCARGLNVSPPTVTSITAKSLVFEDERGVARYRDNVRLTRLDTTVTADAMDAYFKTTDGRRDLDRIEAAGSVAMKRGGSFGTAREAVFHDDTNFLILKDPEGLAEVVDAATGRSMRGRTLTYDLAGDRILTESEHGGRTWITLTPESKDAPSVDPKTHH